MQKTQLEKKGRMYKEALIWNVSVGCLFHCPYCISSFQAQMKRQMPTIDKNGKSRGCQDCYDYFPHFHEERLKASLPKTTGDQFIWCCSSSDIYFAKTEWIEKILERVRKEKNKTFFFQSKAPEVFLKYKFPENVLLGITLETNRNYPINFSKAPNPYKRYIDFLKVKHLRKVVTLEPLMEFDLFAFVMMLRNIAPERIYIGYDSGNSKLNEPLLVKTNSLITFIKKFLPDCKIKPKLMREKHDLNRGGIKKNVK